MPVHTQSFESFEALEALFLERVQSVVWCSAATVSTHNRPRSRIWHPIWEGKTGWLLTWRDTLKVRHLEHNAAVSLAYVADIVRPVYVECYAAWVDDSAQKQRIWDMFLAAPPPMGYNPSDIFERVDHPSLGLLRFTPWRIELFDHPGTSRLWRAAT